MLQRRRQDVAADSDRQVAIDQPGLINAQRDLIGKWCDLYR